MHSATLTYEPYGRATRSLAGVAITAAIHVVAVFLLLQLDAVRSAVSTLPIVVSLIPPEKKIEPEVLPKPLPSKPRVERPKHVEPPPLTTTAIESPAPFVAPPPPPPAPVAPPESVLAVVAAPPAPITPPSFNADYLNNPAPAYPAVSRRMREEGKVMLRVFVTEQGLPREVHLRTSSGHARLDDAALEAVRQWRFMPARRGDTPLGAWVIVPIVFSLRS